MSLLLLFCLLLPFLPLTLHSIGRLLIDAKHERTSKSFSTKTHVFLKKYAHTISVLKTIV